MTAQPKPTREPASRRAGFTLIELLVVISIIAALIGLLLVAVQGAGERVGLAEVQTEIAAMSSGIGKFSSDAEFGTGPVSGIILDESGANWNADAVTKLRKIFGHTFKFNKVRDINGDGDTADTLTLSGAECLVFFLGGIPKIGDTKNLTGFSKNAADPFAQGGSNRHGPYYEFKTGRLVDLDNDGMWEYEDPNGTPYMYLVSYTGGRYASNAPTPWRPFELVIGSGPAMQNAYYETATKPYGKNKFQIISAGEDGQFGAGGVYQRENADSQLIGARAVERDNVTNFSEGTLAD